jgi:Tfp pilus assembly protein PilE
VNFGRNPILLVIALFFLLFIVLNIVNRKSSTSLNDTDRAVRTQQALVRVMNAEEKYFTKNKKYAQHLSDLIPIDKSIATDLTDGVATIQLDSSGDKVYFLAVTSPVVSFTRTVKNGAVLTRSCLQLKSAGDKYCKRKTTDVKKSVPVAHPQIGQ